MFQNYSYTKDQIITLSGNPGLSGYQLYYVR